MKTARETFGKLNSIGYSIELAEKFAIALAGNPAFAKSINDGDFNEGDIIDTGNILAEAFILEMQKITDWPAAIKDEEEEEAAARMEAKQ
ncbi:hypothetical protein FACS1894163_09330 [Spirochaetia bacterium]|nr:hypothetical protein FACS1894163_09330 [Spirochaetia bacterium]